MSVSYYNNVDIDFNSRVNTTFERRKDGSTPIESLQKNIDNKVDTFVDKVDKERKKKSTRTAAAVGGAVIFATAIIALLNPATSAKTIQKLKALQAQTKAELESGKLKGLNKFYKKTKAGIMGVLAKTGELANNYNNGKDILWENLCCREKKCYEKIKSKPIRRILQGIDRGITKPMKKLNDWITGSFDNISKHTVKNRYAKVYKKTETLDKLINEYKTKLPKEELDKLEAKMAELKISKKYISEEQVEKRLKNIEDQMKDLRPHVIEDYKAYGRKLSGKNGNSKTPFGKWIKEMHFFSEQRLSKKKEALIEHGNESIHKLINGETVNKGCYDEIVEILSPHITSEQSQILKTSLDKTQATLRKANISECEKYFDKKRDLTLGSAPTDVLTAGIGLGLAGISVGRGKDKDEKVHRAVSLAIPAVAAVGTSLYLTGNLFTGFKNMIASGAIGFVISKICSVVANAVMGKQDEIIEDNIDKKEPNNV